jgi:hypothetical protein
MNLTASLFETLTAARATDSGPGAEKLYIPWMTRLGPPGSLSAGSIATDSLFIVPQEFWRPFACTICIPDNNCFGGCEGSLGTECTGVDHGHDCHHSFAQAGIDWLPLFPPTVGLWDTDSSKPNEFTIQGQRFPATGNNPLYTLPLRMGGTGDGTEEHWKGTDGSSAEQWTAMAAAMDGPRKLLTMLPLELFATATDSWSQWVSRDAWTGRCNTAFQCELPHRNLVPGSAVPADFAQRWLTSSERQAQSIKRKIAAIHGRLVNIRKAKVKGTEKLTSGELGALRHMYNRAIHLADSGVAGFDNDTLVCQPNRMAVHAPICNKYS